LAALSRDFAGEPSYMSHREIDIGYLARVEGETAIKIRIKDGNVEEIKLKIFEPPRFFEGFLVGRKYDEVGDIVSRICGICPISHMTTAIQALEKAMEIVVSEETHLLRRLLCLSQLAASHLIHLYMLACPDYFGAGSLMQMLPEHGEEAKRFIRMKEVLNSLTAAIGGRAAHPVTHRVGGFTCLPEPGILDKLRSRLEEIRSGAEETVRFIANLDFPDFPEKSEYVALQAEAGYALDDGRIVSDEGLDISIDDYGEYFQEEQVPYAMSKRSCLKGRGSFMVGALSRLNLKFDRLAPATGKIAKEIGFKVPDYNPFHNNLAQALELHSFLEECIEIIGSLELKKEDVSVKIRPGEAGAITEAPRGLLYHWYRVNRKGVIEKADIVTPTAHSFLNIEKDLKHLVARISELPRNEIVLKCEQLVRAYDPCFSCSVH